MKSILSQDTDRLSSHDAINHSLQIVHSLDRGGLLAVHTERSLRLLAPLSDTESIVLGTWTTGGYRFIRHGADYDFVRQVS
jgi:hypothetical protein